MKSLKTVIETNSPSSVQWNSPETPARSTTFSVSEIIVRRDRAITEAEKYQRMLDKEALRLEKQVEDEKRREASDWTTRYKGQAEKILSAVWKAPKRRLTILKILKVGWGRSGVKDATLVKAVQRINKRLEKDGIKYRLIPILSVMTGEIMGYGLR